MIDSPERIVLWGAGSPSREFLYVEDLVEARQLAAERYDGPEPVNVGTGVETPIRELVDLVAEVSGFEGEIVWDTSMPNGQPRRSLDASRARELFGFEARTPLREGLERTVAWYRSAVGIHAGR
jgi:GDP-L-fucose synthase